MRSDARLFAERRSWRGFGIGLGLLLILAAWRAWRKGGTEAPLLAAGLACVMMALLRPDAFRPFYRAWMPAARLLARANTAVVCAILYYLVLTPYALFARAVGARFLEREPKGKDGYWNVLQKRDPAESSRRQF